MFLFVVTYDKQCCISNGIPSDCMGICRDARFESSDYQEIPHVPALCDKHYATRLDCRVPIPDYEGPLPIPMHCNYLFASL